VRQGGAHLPVLAAGAILAAAAVALGAFGTHALQHQIPAARFAWWQTAVQYQMWHALALVALGGSRLSFTRLPAWLIAGGTLIFAATLYGMALGAPYWLGAVTPAGGVLMLAGWALLAWRAAVKPRS
jgi:uncharacterized membrane protein YgdD (TMEM256/DUF423 family)